MTWTQLHKLFDDECRKGHAQITAKIKTLRIDRTGLNKEDYRAADLACAFFAKERKWPLTEPQVNWECFRRLHAARDFARWVSCPDRQNVKYAESLAQKIENRYSDAEMIQWILIDYWWHAGMWTDLYQNPIEKD